jgi:leader peptidase (prepilin peptidase)/N-methyltransferase
MDTLYAYFSANAAAFAALCAVLGLAVGSFLNVVIHRLPQMLKRQWEAECAELQGQEPAADAVRYNLFVPRSACPACNHHISPLHNIPLASYLVLRGKCAACGARIPLRYPVVEALSGAITAYVGWRFGVSWAALAAMVWTPSICPTASRCRSYGSACSPSSAAYLPR